MGNANVMPISIVSCGGVSVVKGACSYPQFHTYIDSCMLEVLMQSGDLKTTFNNAKALYLLSKTVQT